MDSVDLHNPVDTQVDDSCVNPNSNFANPQIGLVFNSEEEAYAFYNNHARIKGFSVRKGSYVRRKDGSIKSRVLLCNKEGSRQVHSSYITKKPRAQERTNCMARVEFKVDLYNKWTLSKMILEHNHELASPNKAHLLKSQRKIGPLQKQMLFQLDSAGIGPSDAYGFMEVANKGSENVGFIPADHYNFLSSARQRNLKDGDAQLLLNYLQDKQKDNINFFYAIQCDYLGQICNFFWADAQCIVDYACFGDVVSFDTTFQTNKYELPFAPILGVNHHNQTVVFGAALLCDETIPSFVWLFEAFLGAMKGKQPKTIFTDQSAAITNAIKVVFPESCHRLCLWHIYQNAAKNLSHVYATQPTFNKFFKDCIYFDGSIEEFEMKWEHLLNMFALQDNKWLKDLYVLREKWAAVFRRDSFCATMTTTQRSESMNRHFKKYFDRKLCLSEFMVKFDRALSKFRRKELYEDFKSRQTYPEANNAILKNVAKMYTRTMFTVFQQEWIEQLNMSVEEVMDGGHSRQYKLLVDNTSNYYYVTYNVNDKTVTCSCKKFEFMGIMCRHALRVYCTHENNKVLLPEYVVKRWTKYARESSVDVSRDTVIDTIKNETFAARMSRMSNDVVPIILSCANSAEGTTIFTDTMHTLREQLSTCTIGNVAEVDSDDNELHEGTLQIGSNVIGSNPNITVKPPPTVDRKGKKLEQKGRHKSVLERRPRRKSTGISIDTISSTPSSIPSPNPFSYPSSTPSSIPSQVILSSCYITV